jgi:hypothetical protein
MKERIYSAKRKVTIEGEGEQQQPGYGEISTPGLLWLIVVVSALTTAIITMIVGCLN